MAARYQLATLTCLLALLFVVATPAHATSIRGGSMYGEGACTVGGTSPCEAFGPTLFVGGHSILQFSFCCDMENPTTTLLDVIDLGPIGSSTTFTLPSAYFGASTTEVFSCGSDATPNDGSSSLTDSGGHPVTASGYPSGRPCTTVSPTTDYTFSLSGTTSSTVSFTTDGGFNVSGDFVVDSVVPQVSPEPSTLMLMGIGLVAVRRKFRNSGSRQIAN